MTNLTSLPPEILSQIISYKYDDNGTKLNLYKCCKTYYFHSLRDRRVRLSSATIKWFQSGGWLEPTQQIIRYIYLSLEENLDEIYLQITALQLFPNIHTLTLYADMCAEEFDTIFLSVFANIQTYPFYEHLRCLGIYSDTILNKLYTPDLTQLPSLSLQAQNFFQHKNLVLKEDAKRIAAESIRYPSNLDRLSISWKAIEPRDYFDNIYCLPISTSNVKELNIGDWIPSWKESERNETVGGQDIIGYPNVRVLRFEREMTPYALRGATIKNIRKWFPNLTGLHFEYNSLAVGAGNGHYNLELLGKMANLETIQLPWPYKHQSSLSIPELEQMVHIWIKGGLVMLNSVSFSGDLERNPKTRELSLNITIAGMDSSSNYEEVISALRDLEDVELYYLADMYEKLDKDDEIQFYIYVCFYIFKNTKSQGYLRKATIRAQKWIEGLEIGDPDRIRRLRLMDTMAAFWGFGEPSKRETAQPVSGALFMNANDWSSYQRLYNEVVQLARQAENLAVEFESTGCLDSLSKSISSQEQIVDIMKDDASPGTLSTLGTMLKTKFCRTGSLRDIDRAIEVTERAANTTTHDDDNQAIYLSDLGRLHHLRYIQTRSLSGLVRAIEICEVAVVVKPLIKCFERLTAALCAYTEHTHSTKHLNRAIDVSNTILDLAPEDHPDRLKFLSDLGSQLSARHRLTGSIDDLRHGIEIMDNVLSRVPPGSEIEPCYLDYLAVLLWSRFKQTRALYDLSRAIEAAETAVNLSPPGDRLGFRLNTLGGMLATLYEHTSDINHLDGALRAAGRAVEATLNDDHYRLCYTYNLGNFLARRFQNHGGVGGSDGSGGLDEIIELVTPLLDCMPLSHTYRHPYLSSLGIWHMIRFQKAEKLGNIGSIEDLNRSVDLMYEATRGIPKDQCESGQYYSNLGNVLELRYERTGRTNSEDLSRALDAFTQTWKCGTEAPSSRIRSALRAANILALQRNLEGASALLEEAIELLPTASPQSLQHRDKQLVISESSGLASTAAAIFLDAGKSTYSALRVLELGRDVVTGQLTEIRGGGYLSNLLERHPALANEFISLRDGLDSPIETAVLSPLTRPDGEFPPGLEPWPLASGILVESQIRQRNFAEQRLHELISEIRSKPGFDNFLVPPTEDEIKAAANPNPIVVINLSKYRCDAFIIERDQIRLLKLPKLVLKDVKTQVRNLKNSRCDSSTLEWLWDSVCGPCLDALGFTETPTDENSWQRVWWIPTGLLSQLPLHAAGYHGQSSNNVLDRVMSSYGSSLKALMYVQRIPISNLTSTDNAIVVAMQDTPGLVSGELQWVKAEIEVVEDLSASLNLRTVKPAPKKADILEHLKEGCRTFHFAGHGSIPWGDPSRSLLLLEDWKTDPLTVDSLRYCNFQSNPPFLAYLSACSTGTNVSSALADEGIHLINGFQLAGFRHVIGTLWEVSDRYCVDMAKAFYENIRDEGMTDVAVCRSLHRAMRKFRDEQMEMDWGTRNATVVSNGIDDMPLKNFYWAPYVHFGV
ncbi:hypothetical protein TWF694_004691 [Orbilia ellipsospora]|uniref:CHAT domain-containing protein n=1 Tax=Orbilia ellipsospora TaxID=2528407 RepID=A0AAV9WXE0_9PEZI